MNGDSILLVEDDKEIRQGVEIFLRSQGYQVFQAENGLEGLKLLEERPIDLAIVDVMMPVMDGITMTAKLREKYDFPVIFLSAKTEEVDKILGLNIGADDYVTKPFSPLELTARVKSQLRRYTEFNPDGVQKKDASEIISIRGVVINRTTHVVTVDGEEIKLTPLEFDILCLLAQNPGKVFSTDEIFKNVWNETVYEANNTVMVHIRRLRTKIKDDNREDKIITTVWGVGYKIDQ